MGRLEDMRQWWRRTDMWIILVVILIVVVVMLLVGFFWKPHVDWEELPPEEQQERLALQVVEPHRNGSQ